MTDKWARRTVHWGTLGLVAGLPFHAFISVWVGHLFGHMQLWQGWKEVVVAAVSLAAAALAVRDPKLLKRLLTPLNLAVGLFVAHAVLLTAAFHGAGRTAVLLGAKTDLEFLVVFLAAQVAASKPLERVVEKIVLVTAGAVSLFALTQALILPKDFLTRFGYSPDTVVPFQTIGDHVRVLSTLGGPNQLGAFLILPIALTLWLVLRRRRWQEAALLAAELGALYYSYSRSAWLGAAAAAAVVAVSSASRRIQTAALVGVLAVFGLGVIVSQQQSVLLHGPAGASDTSDAKHLRAAESGLRAIEQRPLGRGLGSAGPASFSSPTPLIPENYYLQIGVELGVVGLLLFLAVEALLGLKLWGLRHQARLAGPLLGALVGIGVINLFLHGWADSSTALTYWALAGLTIGGGKS